MRIRIFMLLFFSSIFGSILSAQERIEIYLIDSYVTPEKPHTLIISFFTSDVCTSELIIEDRLEFDVSKKFTDDHKFKLELVNYQFDSIYVPFRIKVTDEEGNAFFSEKYEVELPNNNLIQENSGYGLISVCCFGGIIFGLPSPTLVLAENHTSFALSKEIPFLSFYSQGYNYPIGYLGIEYSFIFDYEDPNYLRFGYKHIFQTKLIEYISPGINGFTNFNGFNGVSLEASLGFFRIYNVFTLYAKYRYNIRPSDSLSFNEFSIGLYSNFFSINL